MTIQEFKKIGGILKKAYAEIDKEALAEGFNMLSPEYDQLIDAVRRKILAQYGYTLEEYQEAKNEFLSFKYLEDTKTKEIDEKFTNQLLKHEERIDEISKSIPTRSDVIGLAEEVSERIAEKIAKKYIVPPKITNQIVERIIEKRPIKEVIKIKERVEYNDKKIREEVKNLQKQFQEIKVPDEKQIKNDLFDALKKNIDQEIDILGMPDFRKLGMGLQQQIDELKNDETSGEVNKITAGTGMSVSPSTGIGTVAITNTLTADSFGICLDGQGGVITTGIKADAVIPYAGTITGWTLLADQAGALVVDCWKSTYSAYPPVVGGTIWGGSKPTLSSVTKNQATGLSIAVTSGDIIRFSVDSASTVTRAVLSINITKS